MLFLKYYSLHIHPQGTKQKQNQMFSRSLFISTVLVILLLIVFVASSSLIVATEEDDSVFVHEIDNFKDIQRALVDPRKPSFLLIYDSEQHSSIAEILWPQFASLYHHVGSLASLNHRKHRQTRELFGMKKLELSIRFFRPGNKRFKVGGVGSSNYFTRDEMNALEESISIAEEVCETDIDLLKTEAAKNFLREMKRMIRNVTGGRVHENVQSIKELEAIANTSLNRQVLVHFFPVSNNKKSSSSNNDKYETPIELLLMSGLVSSNLTTAYATVSDRAILHKIMMRNEIEESEEQFKSPRVILFSAEFLRRINDCTSECPPDSSGRPLKGMNDYSPAELAEMVINNTYSDFLEEAVLLQEFSHIFVKARDENDDQEHNYENGASTRLDYDLMCQLLGPFSRPPPSLHHTPVPECTSFRECLTKHPAVPFIVRNTLEFRDDSSLNLTYEKAVKLAMSPPPDSNDIKGAVPVTGKLIRRSVPETMKSWINDTLEANFLYIEDKTKLEWFPRPKVVDEFDRDHTKSFRTLIFTFANGYTGLHSDPAEGGGSWMHLFKGRKLWQFYHPRFHDYFADFPDRQPSELRDRDDQDDVIKTGKKGNNNHGDDDDYFIPLRQDTFSCLAEAGDTVYFPPAFLHRVWTFEKSFGLNSYLTPKGISEEEFKQNSKYQLRSRDRNF